MPNTKKKAIFFNWTPIKFATFVIKEYLHNKCSETASFLTYTTLLSLVPVLAILLMILSSIPVLETAREQVYIYLSTNVLPDSGAQTKDYLTDFIDKSSSVGLVGALALLYTSMALLLKIEKSFNRIWSRGIETEKLALTLKQKLIIFIIAFIRYLFIIIFVPIILGIAFTFSSAIEGLSKIDFGSLFTFIGIDTTINLNLSFLNTPIGIFIIQLLSFLITSLGFALMYWFIPRVKVPFRYAFLSGAITAILFTALKYLFGILMTKFISYSAVYGAFAALPSFMLWLNLSWSLILLGVQCSYCFTHYNKDEQT